MQKASLLLLCFSVSVFAQTAARIVGTVVDSTGAIIPEATIKASDTRTGAEREVQSDDKGFYVLTNLAPSVYNLTASRAQFADGRYNEINLSVGQERTVNIVLQPATVTSEITVSAGELTTIDTSSAAIGATVNAREVATLPINGRQMSQLYLLAPGAVTSGGGSYDNIRFSGRANQQNAIRMDGIEASAIIDASPGNLNGESSTGFRLNSSLETVAEFRVDSSNYPAEFGTGTGGQISVISKSGGNEYHGSLFEYFRNSALDARNFFDGPTKTPLRLNQFGGSIGGPIIKNKLFFFSSVEFLRQRAANNLIANVPSPAARNRPDCPTNPNPADLCVAATIRPLLAGYPTGTPTGDPAVNLAYLQAPTAVDENFGNVRFDYNLNDKTLMYVRYNRDQGSLQAPLSTTAVDGAYSLITAVPQNLVFSLQRIITPNIINEFKAGFNGAKTRIAGYAPPIPGVDTSAFSVNYTGSVAIPGIGGQGASAGAATLGNIVRSNSAQNGRGQPYTNYTLSFIDNLSVVSNSHSMKFGFEFRPIRMYTDRLGGTTYTFTDQQALLQNRPSQIAVLGDTSSNNPFHTETGNRFLKQFYLIGYAQDEWKIRPNFTLSYGLRYEYYSVMKEDRNLFVLFNATEGRLMPDTTPWYKSSKLNFGPRLGLSWSPERFNNKTVLRVGAGYYYGPGQGEDLVQPIDSDRANRTLTNTPFPIIPAQVLAGFDPNNLNGFQPRGYSGTYRLPEKVLSYTFSIQQDLGAGTIFTLAYVGSQGRNLFLRSWTNGIVGVTEAANGNGNAILQFGPQFAQIDYKTNGGTDHYDSMQVSLNRRFSRGLTVGFQWTYGHSIGNTGGSNEAQTAQNPFNFEADRGNNAFDIRHSANLSILYHLPFRLDNKFAQAAIGGWEVGGIWNGRTGLPIDITYARPDIAYRDDATGQIVAGPINSGAGSTPIVNNPYGGAFRSNRRPDVVPGVDPFLDTGDRRFILNPAAFAIPQPGQFGNLGRYALHGPGLSQIDFTVHKQFRITERQNVEFRAEMYNIFNRANFANPPAVLNTALGVGSNLLQPGQPFTRGAAGGAFGVANGTVSRDVGLGAQRQIQFSLRYNF